MNMNFNPNFWKTKRFWIILFFVLLIPVTLYFVLSAKQGIDTKSNSNPSGTDVTMPKKTELLNDSDHTTLPLSTTPENTAPAANASATTSAPISESAPATTPSGSASEKTAATPETNPPSITQNKIGIEIQNWVTPNGAKVFFVATAGLPIIDIKVNFDAGSARDGNLPGLSAFCVQLLDKGVLDLNADQVSAKFEDLGSIYGATLDKDMIQVSLRSLSQPTVFEPLIDLFSNLLASPSFPESQIQIQRNQILVELQRQLQLPHVIASKAFLSALYKDHPYAHPIMGNPDSVAGITRDQLKQFHQRYFVAKNATISLVGGISRQDAEKYALQIASKLGDGNSPAPLPEVKPLNTASEAKIPFPAEQAHVMFGAPCATENDPDSFSLSVANFILGEPLTSRLHKDVRGDRGLAYSVHSTVLEWKRPAPFVIKLQTKVDQADNAIEVMRKTLADYVQKGPTETEIESAKRGLISAFPVSIASNAKISDIISTIGFYDLPLDYLNTYQTKIATVTLADVKEMLQRRLHPDKMALIVVGGSNPNADKTP